MDEKDNIPQEVIDYENSDETTGYESYIQQTAPNATVRLITKSELETLGCSSEDYRCYDAPEWVYSTSFWVGLTDSRDDYNVWYVGFDCYFYNFSFQNDHQFGVRPVIEMPA